MDRTDKESIILSDRDGKVKSRMKLRTALFRLLPGRNLKEQIRIGIDACLRAKELDADDVLFPEMRSDGYRIPWDQKELDSLAVPAESSFVGSFRKTAQEMGLAIGITSLEQHSPTPLNSMILFDRNGKAVLHYFKGHTCDFDDEKALSHGEDFFVSNLDTKNGIVRVGSMICFDREFPESARILMLKGAEVILTPNACLIEINGLSALRTRASENMLAASCL